MAIPIVLVKWVDSQAGKGWRSREDAEKWARSPGTMHLSVGFRLPIEVGGDVVLAQSYQLLRAGSVGDLLQIPKSAIRSVKVLHRIEDP